RHVADEPDIEPDHRLGRPRPEDVRERGDDPDHRARRKSRQSHGKAKAEPPQELIEAAQHGTEVERIAHFVRRSVKAAPISAPPESPPSAPAAPRRTTS